ncbi:hypothetical protein IIA28_15450 [candidate division KSB1 bacterium]|nr:hypothetical protein [candidate division KSB1 bacterium]
MKTISRNEQIINKKETGEGIENVDTRAALIQALIPIALQSVDELHQQEVEQLAGAFATEGSCRGKLPLGSTERLGLSG